MSDVCHRLRYIDIAKGILIICVVIGHVFNFEYIITAWIKSIICTFHMPAFFIISGILTNKDRVSKETLSIFFLRKIKRLIIPYVLFEIIGGILSMAIYGIENVNLVGIVYGILTIHCHIGADWFLPTLFFAEILLFINLKYIVKINPLFTAIVSFLAAFLIPDLNYTVAVIRRILIAFGFITAGHICKDAFVKKSMFGLIVSTILLLLITYFNRVVDLSSRSFNNPILYVLGGIVGSYFILDLSQYLFGKLGEVLAAIGKESLMVMGTHQHIMLIANASFGSVYSLCLQLILLPIIAVYEYVVVKSHFIASKMINELWNQKKNQ